jgi:hypothetical protein
MYTWGILRRYNEVKRGNERWQRSNKTEMRCEETATKEVAVKQNTDSRISTTMKTYRLEDIVHEAVEDSHRLVRDTGIG